MGKLSRYYHPVGLGRPRRMSTTRTTNTPYFDSAALVYRPHLRLAWLLFCYPEKRRGPFSTNVHELRIRFTISCAFVEQVIELLPF